MITLNEGNHVGRALESVRWMDEIVVLDSGSTDDTVEIAERHGAKVRVESFQGYVVQKNKAMSLCQGTWLFNIDADEEVTPELRNSIEEHIRRGDENGLPSLFKVSRKTRYLDRWIRHCGWYPEYRARLSRREYATWTGEMLHEKLEGDAPAVVLAGDLLHRPYDDLGDHLRTIDRYSSLWAQREAARGRHASFPDLLVRPPLKFFKMYLFKRGFLDGGAGLIASCMGAGYTFMKYARLYESTRGTG